MFEPVHVSAPDIPGKRICNTIGQIWSDAISVSLITGDAHQEPWPHAFCMILSYREMELLMANVSPVLSVRVSPAERDILEFAAEQACTSLSDFVRRKAMEAAEMEVLDHRLVTIPAADWEKFEAWVDAPAKDVPALRKLAASRPAWQD